MTDETATKPAFAPFRPAVPAGAKPVSLATSAGQEVSDRPKPARKRPAKSKTAAVPAAEKPKRKYKKRDPNKARKPRAIKVEIGTAFEMAAGVKDKDRELVVGIIQALSAVNKAGRKRIVIALNRIFV